MSLLISKLAELAKFSIFGQLQMDKVKEAEKVFEGFVKTLLPERTLPLSCDWSPTPIRSWRLPVADVHKKIQDTSKQPPHYLAFGLLLLVLLWLAFLPGAQLLSNVICFA